jgi:hypothetical protein
LKVRIDGKDLDFALREIDEANEIFQQAVDQGAVAAVGLKNESSDALHVEVGNVPPQCDIEIQFECSLSAILTHANQLRFPIPRGTESGLPALEIDVNVQQIGSIQSVVMDQDGFTFQTKSETEGQIKVNSPPSQHHRPLDIIVNLLNEVGTEVITTTIDGQAYAGIAAVANIPSKEDLKCEFYLVIDCSGSMSGHSIAVARETMIYCLKSLPKGCLFNVIRFGSGFEAMFPTSQPFTADAQQLALDNIRTMDADLGGTDLYSPLSYILDLPTVPGHSRQVFVLTDGHVEGEAEIIALATRHRRNHRIFSVGIGGGVDRTFIEDLAVCTGGESAFVPSSGDEALMVTMAQLKSALRPAAVECQLHISDTETFELSPFPLPTLFHNVLCHVYVRAPEISDDAGILISGRAGDKQIDLSAAANKVAPLVRLDKFFAYFNIRDLEERISLAPEPEVPILKERVVRLSMQATIVSQFTALCGAVDGAPQVQHRRPDQSSPARVRVQATPPPGIQIAQPKQAMTKRQQRGQRAWDDRMQGIAQVPQPMGQWGAQPGTPGCQKQAQQFGPPVAQRQRKQQLPVQPQQQQSQRRQQQQPQQPQPQQFQPQQPQPQQFQPQQFQPQQLQPQQVQPQQLQPQQAIPQELTNLRGLIAVQAFDGYWNVSFAGFDRVPWDTFAALAALADGSALELIEQTLYALAVLEKNGSDKRVLWCLVGEKAKDWLKTQSPVCEWDVLIAELQEFVP